MSRLALLEKIDVSLKAQAWQDQGTVVAISGGPDSVALFLGLREVRPDARLILAHLNHGLRGPDSDADETFVAQLYETCAKSGPLELRRHRIDVAAQATAEHGNLEAVARRVRYEWLQSVAMETGCRWLVTGHTADDQAETVLHRIVRGSGLRGLRGIAPRKPLSSALTLLRPMLAVTRSEVLEFLQVRQQNFRLDRSNLDLAHTRNRIRHELLPLLASQYNPDIARLLGQLASQAEESFAQTEARAEELLRQAELPRAGSLLIFNRAALAGAPRHLVCEMFRLVWQREQYSENDMTFEAWGRMAAIAQGEQTAVDLPGGIRLSAVRGVVQLGPPS